MQQNVVETRVPDDQASRRVNGKAEHGNGHAKRSRDDVEQQAARSRAQSDRQLVDRCLRGEAGAWDELYRQCHPPLLLAIRLFLGHSSTRQDLIDDIAAKVWFTVVDGQNELLSRFDSQRGCRLTTFLAGVARNEIARHFRAERRRRYREIVAYHARYGNGNGHSPHWQSLAGMETALTEFLATLTPREREFCEGYLLAWTDNGDANYSASNRWQLQHRVRRKLWRFLRAE